MNKKNFEAEHLQETKNRKLNYLPAVLFTLMLLFSFGHSFSQPVFVKASIDKKQILIGEPIKLKLEVSVPAGTEVKWFLLDTIPHFDLIEKAKIDTVENADSRTFRQIVTITSFDSGSRMLPSLPVGIKDVSYLTDSIPVSVGYSSFDPTKNYHDIKDILAVENPYLRYINWCLAVVTLLSLLGFVYFMRKRAVKEQLPAKVSRSSRSPLEEALQSLNELKKQQLAEQGQVKLYYTRLNDILRVFISRQMSTDTMEKTNDELIVKVKQLGLVNDSFIPLAQTLRMTDAVKFARFVPGLEDNEQSFRVIKASVESLNNLSTK